MVTATGAAALQMITPNQMRAQTTALYYFVINILGLLGPTAVGLVTDFGFGDDDALRWSLAIVCAGASVLGPGISHGPPAALPGESAGGEAWSGWSQCPADRSAARPQADPNARRTASSAAPRASHSARAAVSWLAARTWLCALRLGKRLRIPAEVALPERIGAEARGQFHVDGQRAGHDGARLRRRDPARAPAA